MLTDGIYEQVINKKMNSELSSTDKLSQTAPIDTAEASKVLAKYVAEVVERGLENLKDNGGNLSDQVALANQIITTIQAETKEADFDALSVAERAEQLLSLFDRQNSIWAIDEKAQVPFGDGSFFPLLNIKRGSPDGATLVSSIIFHRSFFDF